MTVRARVKQIQVELRDGRDIPPMRLAEMLMQLTAMIGNCNAEIREADAEFATVLLTLLDQEKKANRAKIRAETTDAYQRKREARDTKELVLSMVGSLKYSLRALEEEMRLAK